MIRTYSLIPGREGHRQLQLHEDEIYGWIPGARCIWQNLYLGDTEGRGIVIAANVPKGTDLIDSVTVLWTINPHTTRSVTTPGGKLIQFHSSTRMTLKGS
jgi:hypothetical protein